MPKPKNDDGYFEMMSRAVFAAGLNWSVVDKKWPEIKLVFDNFVITWLVVIIKIEEFKITNQVLVYA